MELEQIRANIKKWVEALESGEYKQGSNALCSIQDEIPHYCCLGVANEVCNLNANPASLYLWIEDSAIGLISPAGDLVQAYHTHHSLACMNDSGQFSFKEIATYIKENPENVFTEEVSKSLIDNPIW